jgi:hypothetical protein
LDPNDENYDTDIIRMIPPLPNDDDEEEAKFNFNKFFLCEKVSLCFVCLFVRTNSLFVSFHHYPYLLCMLKLIDNDFR